MPLLSTTSRDAGDPRKIPLCTAIVPPTVPTPQQPEVGRRLRAAMAYGSLPIAAAAFAMDVSESHLSRFTDRKAQPGDYAPTWQQLWAVADACGLPRDWFSADLDRLGDIVPEGMPRFGSMPSERQKAREAFQRALGERARPSTALPEAAPETKRAPRRRRRGAS